MKQVTDPNLLAILNSSESTASTSALPQVTDPELLAQLNATEPTEIIQDEINPPKESANLLKWALGGAENVAGMLAQIPVDAVSGVAGLGSMALGGDGANTVKTVQNALGEFLPPYTNEGKVMQEKVGETLGPVVEWIDDQTAGRVAEAGYPMLATALHTAPEALSYMGVGGAVLRQRIRTRQLEMDRIAELKDTSKYDTRTLTTKQNRLINKLDVPKETVSVIEKADPVAKNQMRALNQMLKRGATSAVARIEDSYNSVIGAPLASRLTKLNTERKALGTQVDEAAKALKGNTVSLSPAVGEMVGAIKETYNTRVIMRNGKLELGDPPEGSFLSLNSAGARNTRKALEDFLAIINGNNVANFTFDGLDAHKMKRTVDSLISGAKAAEGGLDNAIQRIAVGLRKEINQKLRDLDPDNYGAINDRLSAVIGLEEQWKTLAPGIDDWTSKEAAMALGQKLNSATDMNDVGAQVRMLDDSLKELNIKGVGDDPLAVMLFYRGMNEYLDSPQKLQEFLKKNNAALDQAKFDALASAGVGNVFGLVHDVNKMQRAGFNAKQIKIIQRQMSEVYDAVDDQLKSP